MTQAPTHLPKLNQSLSSRDLFQMPSAFSTNNSVDSANPNTFQIWCDLPTWFGFSRWVAVLFHLEGLLCLSRILKLVQRLKMWISFVSTYSEVPNLWWLVYLHIISVLLNFERHIQGIAFLRHVFVAFITPAKQNYWNVLSDTSRSARLFILKLSNYI